MVPVRLLVPLIALAVGLAGCDSMQYVQRGDQAMIAGNAGAALRNYQQAAASDSNLRNDAVFRAKLHEASWRAAFEDGEAASRQSNWPQAIRSYEEVLRLEPGYTMAAEGLSQAKKQGAQQLYEHALQVADAGNLNQAGNDLSQAVAWDASHSPARTALDSLQRRGNAASEQAYDAAVRLMDQKDWTQADRELSAIIAGDPNHLPSRASLRKARDQTAQSRKTYESASRLYSEKRLDDAIAAAKQALAVWSTNAEAADILAKAQADRQRSEQLFEQAKGFAGQQNWDAAIAAADQSLQVYPFHPSAPRVLADARQSAAAALVAEGQRHLKAGEPEKAAGSFRSALAYVPGDPVAKDGLIDVAYEHGRGAEKDGLWGSALLWYLDAVSQRSSSQFKQAEARARAAVELRAAMAIALSVGDARGQATADSNALENKLAPELTRTKPAFVTLVPAAGNAPPNSPLYKAAVTLNRIEVNSRLVSRDARTHVFQGVRQAPNPAVPALERDLAQAERDLAFARSRLIRYSCDPCGGRGHTDCSFCRGGHVACNYCKGAGKTTLNKPCSACGGRGYSICTRCRGGHFHCSRCGGRGFYNDYDHALVRGRERDVAELRRRLRYEPVLIDERYEVRHPYVQEVHEKTGRLDAQVSVNDAAANAAAQTFDVNPSFNQVDTAIINANPALGLRDDPLSLPDDGNVHRALLEDGAARTAKGILQAAVVARANQFIAQANDFAKAGNVEQDVEARMTAAVMLQSVRPDETKRILSELRNPKN